MATQGKQHRTESARKCAEEANDERVARMRLAEIERDPTKLIRGKALEDVLDRLVSKSAKSTLI